MLPHLAQLFSPWGTNLGEPRNSSTWVLYPLLLVMRCIRNWSKGWMVLFAFVIDMMFQYIMLVLVEVWKSSFFSDVEKSYGQRTMCIYIYAYIYFEKSCIILFVLCFHYDFCTPESIPSILFILLMTVKAKLWRDVIPKPCSISFDWYMGLGCETYK